MEDAMISSQIKVIYVIGRGTSTTPILLCSGWLDSIVTLLGRVDLCGGGKKVIQ